MRTMMIALAAILLASPLSAQTPDPALATAWRTMPADPRLRADFKDARGGGAAAELGARMELHQVALLGAAIGCVGGALIMGASANEGEVAVMRFNGCILGASVGGFLGGIYGLATGR